MEHCIVDGEQNITWLGMNIYGNPRMRHCSKGETLAEYAIDIAAALCRAMASYY